MNPDPNFTPAQLEIIGEQIGTAVAGAIREALAELDTQLTREVASLHERINGLEEEIRNFNYRVTGGY